MTNSKKGFTLAEVLITLLIIGIISSIVIPGLINDTRDAELHAAWKKAYSSINQSYKLIIMDNGGTFINAAANNQEFRNLFKDKMNFITTCDDRSCSTGYVKRLNGDPDTYNFINNLVLNDGTILSVFQLDKADCTAIYSLGHGVCGWMLVNINGKKGPNQWGKDIYGIWVMDNKIIPWGANPNGTVSVSAPYRESTCTTSDTGYGCGAKYLYN